MKYQDNLLASHKSAVLYPAPNLLNEDVCLPAAVIKQSALDNNIAWMQAYADARGVCLAPHGKTTMTPEIFKKQQAAGAWAIGVGSAWQASVAFENGIQRVLMVNQLVGKANMQLIASLLKRYPNCEYYCCIDSVANAKALSAFFAEQHLTLNVLIELGVPGGRCGCRTSAQALALAEQIDQLPNLRLSGLELYEGVIHGDEPQPKIEKLLAEAAELACQLEKFVTGEFILTGAGSVWYDVVCNVWLKVQKPQNCRLVIRPGCYITHDQGIYQTAQDALMARDKTACDLGGDLVSALELVAFVQSVPESGRAIVNIGKRDSAFDAGLPQAIGHYRQGQALSSPKGKITTTGIMDQHAMTQFTDGVDVQVGDILVLSTSHPCLTFDKWKVLHLVDDNYQLIDSFNTEF